jgi:DNA-binding NtrC family response regulator
MDILLIDDDDWIRGLLVKFLGARGHSLAECSTAEEAMIQYGRLFYPMIVVDVGLTAEAAGGAPSFHPGGHRERRSGGFEANPGGRRG